MPLPFILTVLFIISQTLPAPNFPGGGGKRKQKELYHFVDIKTIEELTTENMLPCRSDTLPVSANQEHIHHL